MKIPGFIRGQANKGNKVAQAFIQQYDNGDNQTPYDPQAYEAIRQQMSGQDSEYGAELDGDFDIDIEKPQSVEEKKATERIKELGDKYGMSGMTEEEKEIYESHKFDMDDEDLAPTEEDIYIKLKELNKNSNRFSKEPNIKDYGINDELKNNLRDYEYYSRIEDINKELENEKSWRTKMQNERWRTQDDFDTIDRRISLLADPRIQKYVNDRNAFNKQFENDYNEYKPIAKEAIIAKLLSDQDLYDIESNSNVTNDLYDQVNNDFAKKYGYERTNYGDMFRPGRRGFVNFLGDEERITMQDGSRAYKRKLNKDKYLADLLEQGEITVADLRRLLK